MDYSDQCKEAILEGDTKLAQNLAKKVISENYDINSIIDSLSLAIREAGDLFEEGEFFLPELMRSAEAMKAAMEILTPKILEQKESRTIGTAVIGTIEGDIHDIGKTLVAAMLSAEGFEVHDLGSDVPVDSFVNKAVEVNADLICVSALLTTTMVGQKRLIERLEEQNIRQKYKVLIGGAPVSKKWVEEIGADGSAENAISAVKIARRLIGK